MHFGEIKCHEISSQYQLKILFIFYYSVPIVQILVDVPPPCFIAIDAHGSSLGPGHIVLDGTPFIPLKGVYSTPPPIFGPYVYCGQKAKWIKIPLDTEA